MSLFVVLVYAMLYLFTVRSMSTIYSAADVMVGVLFPSQVVILVSVLSRGQLTPPPIPAPVVRYVFIRDFVPDKTWLSTLRARGPTCLWAPWSRRTSTTSCGVSSCRKHYGIHQKSSRRENWSLVLWFCMYPVVLSVGLRIPINVGCRAPSVF